MTKFLYPTCHLAITQLKEVIKYWPTYECILKLHPYVIFKSKVSISTFGKTLTKIFILFLKFSIIKVCTRKATVFYHYKSKICWKKSSELKNRDQVKTKNINKTFSPSRYRQGWKGSKKCSRGKNIYEILLLGLKNLQDYVCTDWLWRSNANLVK